jgi:hypothetical protein
MRYSLANLYLKNDNAFLTFLWIFFIAILARFRQGYTVNLPAYLFYIKFKKNEKINKKYVLRIFLYIFY